MATAQEGGENLGHEIRDALRLMLVSMYPDYENLFRAADVIGVSHERARQAHKYGKSIELMLSLVVLHIGVEPSQLPQFFPKMRKFFANPEGVTVTEQLIEEARSRMTENEFIAELRTIIARDEIARELNLKGQSPVRPK